MFSDFNYGGGVLNEIAALCLFCVCLCFRVPPSDVNGIVVQHFYVLENKHYLLFELAHQLAHCLQNYLLQQHCDLMK